MRAADQRTCSTGTNSAVRALFHMTDPFEDILAPAVIERPITVFESFKVRSHCEIVQARKALTPHIFGLIESGQRDEQRLLVRALTYLKSLEKRAKAATP
jgi:hypothetical protein